MNCDQAFDSLTDPLRRNSDELRQHLQACPRCRQMEETLQPALELFGAVAGESADSEESGSKPPWDSVPSPQAVQVAQSTAQELASRVSPSHTSRQARWKQALALAAVLLIGAMTTVGIDAFLGNAGAPGIGIGARQTGAGCTWQTRNADADGEREADSRGVVLSCVACHLKSPVN
jgi:hypothetical protein